MADSPAGVLLSLALTAGIAHGFASCGIVVCYRLLQLRGFRMEDSPAREMFLNTGTVHRSNSWGILMVSACFNYEFRIEDSPARELFPVALTTRITQSPHNDPVEKV